MLVESSTNSEGHLVIDFHAHLTFSLILRFSPGEWSNTAVNSDFSFHVFELVQEGLSLLLLLPELLGHSVKVLLLALVVGHECVFLRSHVLEFLLQLLSRSSLFHQLFNFLKELFLLSLLVGKLHLQIVNLSTTVLHILSIEGQLVSQLLNLSLLFLDLAVSLIAEILLSLGKLCLVLSSLLVT